LASHKSAIKRSKQSEKRRERNITAKSTIKTSIKSVLGVLGEKDKEGAKTALAKAIPTIQKGVAKGVLHKKTASRKISRLTKKVNTLVG
jgi:small subunit ribosomal protein S20